MTIQEWLGEDNELGISIWERKYRNNNESFDEWIERVSGGNKSVGELIKKKQFLFGGRILANRGLNKKDKKITYSNCFSGDTRIWTKQGLKSLAELEGQTVKVFTKNGGWEDASIQCFGEQPVKKLILKRGKIQQEILVTGDHIWFVENDRKACKEIKTDDLKPGMKLLTASSRCYRNYKPSPFGVAHGFFTGDGDHNSSNPARRINICKGKEEMLEYYMPDTIGHSGEVTTICSMPHFFYDKPPLDESPSYLYGWLAGYFAADGSIDERGNCVISSCNKSDLEYVQDVMCVLGIPPYSITEQNRISNLTNKESIIYKVTIPSAYLNESFFILTKHRERFNSSARKPNRWTVQEVTDIIDTIPVYCAVEPKTQSFTIEGNIVTHNCYVITSPEDNLESIFECAKKLARTYSYGGGCGVDLSQLAPNGAIVRNAAKTSSGAVSFMDLYSTVTESICQSGRRGALMISMACNHPDVEAFVDIKKDLTKVTKANTSLRIFDDFMEAVKNDTDYVLSFIREATGEKIEKVIKARELFRKIAYNNWDMGEPGMLFWDRIEGWNLLSEYEDFHYGGVNP